MHIWICLIDGFGCSISFVDAMEIPQPCTKPSIHYLIRFLLDLTHYMLVFSIFLSSIFHSHLPVDIITNPLSTPLSVTNIIMKLKNLDCRNTSISNLLVSCFFSITSTCFTKIWGIIWGIINSLRPSAAYMHQQSMPSLVQIMACHLDGAKPLSEPMLEYCQLDSWEQTSVKS